MSWINNSRGQVVLDVRVTPRAARNTLQGRYGDALKVRLQAPPVEGRANQALIEFFSELLDIPRRQITLLAGAGSRHKRLAIAGLSAPEVCTRLGMDPQIPP